jgi:hypothetical protein
MKNKKQILDVDFIGGQGELTSTEEKALSEYFNKKKLKQTSKKYKPRPLDKRKKLTSV